MSVYTEDLAILQTYWKKKDPEMPGNCVERGCSEAARGNSSSAPSTAGELLDWLAEIWLDPDVRESIEVEDWLKMYLSLKKEEGK